MNSPVLDPARRWRVLALLATAQFLGMSLWFTASAVAPQLQHLWDLDAQQTGTFELYLQLRQTASTWRSGLIGPGRSDRGWATGHADARRRSRFG
jgi:hypothetical protein